MLRCDPLRVVPFLVYYCINDTSKINCCHLHLKLNSMQDYLFTVECTFVNTETGEIFSKSYFHKPLSILEDEDINRYLHSFIRGIRQGKSIGLNISICKDCDLPKITEQSFF